MVRRNVTLWTAILVIGYSLLTFAAEWSPVAEKLAQSIVYIENSEGSCTGFVINAAYKGDTDLVLTAAHCDGAGLLVDSLPAKLIWKDTKSDLMVVQIDDTGRPAAVVAKADPKQGDEIASFGYGAGLEKPMFRTAHIANPSISIPGIEGNPYVMTDAAYVGGQSGGPCVNAAGEVVSIVQRTNGAFGVGVGAERIRGKVGRYLGKP
jgi:S1-C subfamily serine protease